MGKKKYKLASIIAMVLGIIVMIAIGGSFISGKFMDVFILKFLPLIVHQIVGGIIVGGALLSGILSLIGK